MNRSITVIGIYRCAILQYSGLVHQCQYHFKVDIRNWKYKLGFTDVYCNILGHSTSVNIFLKLIYQKLVVYIRIYRCVLQYSWPFNQCQ